MLWAIERSRYQSFNNTTPEHHFSSGDTILNSLASYVWCPRNSTAQRPARLPRPASRPRLLRRYGPGQQGDPTRNLTTPLQEINGLVRIRRADQFSIRRTNDQIPMTKSLSFWSLPANPKTPLTPAPLPQGERGSRTGSSSLVPGIWSLWLYPGLRTDRPCAHPGVFPFLRRGFFAGPGGQAPFSAAIDREQVASLPPKSEPVPNRLVSCGARFTKSNGRRPHAAFALSL